MRTKEELRKAMKEVREKTRIKPFNPISDTQVKAKKIGKEIKKMSIGEPIA